MTTNNDTKWTDFNDAQDNKTFTIIPKGTLAKVRMNINPGCYSDPEQGWTDGYATCNKETKSVYLSVTYVILEGPFAHQQIRGLIGLHSEKGPTWAEMGRSFIKAALSSACGVRTSDNSDQARNLRKINDFGDLNGIEFVARIDVKKEKDNLERNIITQPITCEHHQYALLMGKTSSGVVKPIGQTPTQNQDKKLNPGWAQ